MAEQRSVFGVVRRFLEDYASGTPTKLKLIDAYMGGYCWQFMADVGQGWELGWIKTGGCEGLGQG